MRTRDLTDPRAWRAWNGSDFSATLSATAYDTPAPDPRQHVCQPTINMTCESRPPSPPLLSRPESDFGCCVAHE